MQNKKGQTSGLITSLVFGIAFLVIGVIIALVITSTLNGAGLLTQGRTTSSVANETGGFVNTTGYALSSFDSTIHLSPTIATIYNATGELVDSGNYTVSSVGVVTNTSGVFWNDVNISYSYTIKSNEEQSTDRLSANFTKGVDNVSTKIPTVLLVAAIVLIIGILAVLVGVWQKMRLTGGQSL